MADVVLVPELNHQSLTTVANRVKSPGTFVFDMLFRSRNTHETETLEVGRWLGARRMVPFVKKDAVAYPIKGVDSEFEVIQAPNIRVKISHKPTPLLFARQPGTPVFIREGDNLTSAQSLITRNVQYMNDGIANREEWMACQALEGVIDYSVGEGITAEAFQFDYNRDAGNTTVLAGAALWDSGTQDIHQDQLDAKRVSNEEGVQVTDAIMGQDAAAAWLDDADIRAALDNIGVNAGGPLLLDANFRPDGALFLGRVYNINWWEYSRSVLDEAGATIDLINKKKVFFVTQSAAAGFSMEYGAIPDMDAFAGGSLRARRFSKAWTTPDPSLIWSLVHSRPFPLMLNPEAVVEYQVLP